MLRRFIADNYSMLKYKTQQFDSFNLSHSGMQRSGTNYLCYLLNSISLVVANKFDPYRNHPGHKHFRLMDDKSSIVMDPKSFDNTLTIQSIEELNIICGYPKELPHIVIFKEPIDWLQSIKSWADKCDWSSARHTLWAEDYLREWDLYYSKWQELHKKNDSLVKIVSFQSLRSDPQRIIDEICADFNFGTRALKNGGKVDEVPRSPKNRKKADIQISKNIEDAVASLKFDWKLYR